MARQINFHGNLIKIYGSYIRTDLSGLTDISGVASGIIGMVGMAEKGPSNQAVRVNSFTQLVETFGDGPLVRHGLAAYVGGARELVCVRIGDPNQATLSVIAVNNAQPGTVAPRSYAWEAREAGTLGNNIMVSVRENTRGTATEFGDDVQIIEIRYVDERGNDLRELYQVPKYIPNCHRRFFDTNFSSAAVDRINLGTELAPIWLYGEVPVADRNHYYVLKNIENGIIRDIPATWGVGNPTRAAFLEKVEQLKSTSEELIGPFPWGRSVTVGATTTQINGQNPYPIAIIQNMINVGSLGFGPSALVQMIDANPTATQLLLITYNANDAEALLEHGFVALGGGSNGEDGTGFYGARVENPLPGMPHVNYDTTFGTEAGSPLFRRVWTDGLGVLEDEEVNFVQPAYLFNFEGDGNQWTNRYGFFKSLTPLILAHVLNMSSLKTRKFRTTVLGLPFYRSQENSIRTANDFLSDIRELSGLVNHERVQLWAGGFYSRAFSNRVESYGADMLASFVVGAHASRGVSESLTFDPLSGIFTDGLEFSFRESQKEELYSRSLAFAKKRRTITGALQFVAAHNETSFVGSPSRGIQNFTTMRIVDFMNTFMYKNLEENFIGVKARGADTIRSLTSFASAMLNRLIRDDILVAHAGLTVYTEPGNAQVYYIEYDFQPVTEIKFIPVTNRLLYTLA